jgi:NtrC-family two-component system response regulator AlgB
VVLGKGKELTPAELPDHLANFTTVSDSGQRLTSLAEMEKTHIQQALAQSPSIDEAARVLGIDPATLWRKRKKYHID